MGRQKPGQALAWRTGVAEQDRVVAGVWLPSSEEPPLTTESRMTPLSTQFLKNHQNAQQCLCHAAPVWASQCLACPEWCLDLACPS